MEEAPRGQPTWLESSCNLSLFSLKERVQEHEIGVRLYNSINVCFLMDSAGLVKFYIFNKTC